MSVYCRFSGFARIFSLSQKEKMKKRKLAVRKKMLEALGRAPIRQGFTAKELAKEVNMPQPTTRVHLELLEESDSVESYYIGKSRVYRLKKK